MYFLNVPRSELPKRETGLKNRRCGGPFQSPKEPKYRATRQQRAAAGARLEAREPRARPLLITRLAAKGMPRGGEAPRPRGSVPPRTKWL